MKLVIGSDHAGFETKALLIDWLHSIGHHIDDLGTHKDRKCHYPTYAFRVARRVVSQQLMGLLICGSGIGMSMSANRFKGVRAALCRTIKDVKLSREHNNSNILCLGAREHTIDEMKALITLWLDTKFLEGRHLERITLFHLLGEE